MPQAQLHRARRDRALSSGEHRRVGGAAGFALPVAQRGACERQVQPQRGFAGGAVGRRNQVLAAAGPHLHHRVHQALPAGAVAVQGRRCAGEQACGDVGAGRMLEPLQLVSAVEEHFLAEQKLNNIKITITAGPTREAIDPVRYISNHSSGKMGFALAKAAAAMGADVTLISGPVQLATPTGVKRLDVTSAQQMYDAAMAQAVNSDIFIGCAAVADYRVAEVASEKMKKQADNNLQLTLVQNPDIIASVAALTTARPFTVGFAAETEKVADHARQKLQKKNLDLICANDVSDPALGFNSEQNAITVYSTTAEFALGQRSKTDLAQALISLIYEQYQHEKKH